MRRGSLIAIGVIPALGVGLIQLAPALAIGPTPTCFGKPATVVGTNGDDELVGTGGDDVIVALDGQDSVYGQEGNDLVCADAGDDHLNGGPGDDHLDGGPGFDYFYSTTQQSEINLSAGTTDGEEGSDFITLQSIEGIRIGDCVSGQHVLIGDDRFNSLLGNEGRDTIRGKGGDDSIFADGENEDSDICPGGSADRTYGGTGRDGLAGGPGNDLINGGRGRDGANAGSGRDECISVETSYNCERFRRRNVWPRGIRVIPLLSHTSDNRRASHVDGDRPRPVRTRASGHLRR
ncbi:MAG: hypothetical protein QOG54_1800 [Actinomycetota bacterium]|jgi:Ca2+-binding RTX toxin-like protein|nr:hypothetical protein [Actinomycetota bacterium]